MNGVSKLVRGFACGVAALCAGSAVNAWAETLGEKTPLSDDPGVGWTREIENDDQTVDVVVAFTNTSAYTEGYSFAIPAGVSKIDYLVVGGGGAGGSYYIAGGGGAGGVLTNAAPVAVTAGTSLSVVVGKGGTAVKSKSGGNGTSSKLSGADIPAALEAYGGGGGGYAGAGVDGASGGGAAGGTTKDTYVGGTGIDGQGHKGGGIKAQYIQRGASGGGGAGEDGGTGSGYAAPGKGGDGILSTITGEEVWYAGGGSGATSFNGTVAAGGRGGGGVGGQYAGSAGQDGYGGGGGGGGYGSSLGGNGGSGIVVIRYTKAVVASFTYDSDKCVVDVNGTRVVGTSAGVAYNADAVITVTPSSTYEYKSAPSEWGLVGGSITKTYTSVTADFAVVIPDPEEKAGEKVAITFTEAVHAKKVATIGGIEIGSEVLKGSTVVVVATPNAHYEYASVPLDWEGGATSITNTFVANEATNVVIPEPTPIMIPVTVTGLANTTYTISTNGVVISNGVVAAESAVVPEGTVVTITVTPADEYEYSSKPEGWTKNADGSISREYETVRDMAAIAIPNDKFRMKQVALTIQPSHTATCVVSNGSVAVSGATVNTNATLVATITQKTTEDGGRYVYESAPEGWTAVAGAEGSFSREYFATAPVTITVPNATWVPSVKGNQIDNGDLEQIPTKANVSDSRYNWYLSNNAYVFYCKEGGHRDAGINGNPLGDYGLIYKTGCSAYCKVKITDRKASYKLTYRAKNSQSNQPLSATLVVDVLDEAGNSVFEEPISKQYVQAASDVKAEEDWTLGQSEEFHFPSNGTYRIRFTPTYEGTGGKRMGFLDNVRLTMKPAPQRFTVIIK